jgi:hypothetical protein
MNGTKKVFMVATFCSTKKCYLDFSAMFDKQSMALTVLRSRAKTDQKNKHVLFSSTHVLHTPQPETILEEIYDDQ